MLTVLAVVASVMGQTVDYAGADRVDDWLRHPVFGDPSFDTFKREPGNPLHRGSPPFEWPVNGFFFEDPQSGNWYVYVGLYAQGYAMDEGKRSACTAFRSRDRGRTWEAIGAVFPEEPFRFRGDTDPIGHAPDVSVVYDDGAYHMIYDWASASTTWATASEPTPGVDNGIAYARAERPEGPFITTPEPVYRTSAQPLRRGKYRRGYAATLVRRKDDWMVLAMTDSGPNFSWAMIGMSSKSAEGPYSEPVFLRAVEDDYFHPPLLEFFPAFTHGGRVYAPATSVALNRNYQVLFSAPLEKAMEPAAWEITRLGSIWHAEAVPNEYFGIWGQTFTGFVDREGIFRVMFPSRERENIGTINLASRPWDTPLKDGFVMTGHAGPSLALLRRSAEAFTLEAELKVRGKATIVWDYRAPLGPNRPAADATLHPLSLTRYSGWELSDAGQRAVRVDGAAREHSESIAADSPAGGDWKIGLTVHADGRVEYSSNGSRAAVVEGPPPAAGGCIGLLVGPDSRCEVTRFALSGETHPARCSLLYTEAILGAGAAKDSWQTVERDTFRFGVGGESLKADAMGKWNFEGGGFALWLPRGPRYGEARVWLDGVELEPIDLHADSEEASAPRLSREKLAGRLHTLIVRPKEGVVPLDALEVSL